MDKVSVVIPIYNMEKYMDECISSVVNQTYKNIEIILVDDGSRDNSPIKCDDWMNKDSRIKVIHKINKGLSSARNIGIKNSTGKYIMFLDSDDSWMNNKCIELLVARMNKTGADVVSFNYKKIYDEAMGYANNEKTYFNNIPSMPVDLTGEQSLKYIIENNLWLACAWNKILKRDLFDKDNLFFKEGITSEDIDWCARVALESKNFDYFDICVVGYRQTENSISRGITLEKTICLLKNIENTRKLIENHGSKTDLLKGYLAYQVGTFIINVSLVENKNEREDLIKSARDIADYMKFGRNKRIRILYGIIKILGMKNTVFLIHNIRK